MEPVVNATTTAIIRSLIRAIRAGALEVEIHRLELDILQVRLSRQIEAFSAINNLEPMQNNSQAYEEQQRQLAEIIAAVQHVLSHAQQDAVRLRATVAGGAGVGSSLLAFLDKCRAQKARAISRMQWAVYRRDRCERNLAAITTLIVELERLANS
jgi:prophage DNA circulation protein